MSRAPEPDRSTPDRPSGLRMGLVVPCPPDPRSAVQERLVWYVSYGSNLSPIRFACYLAGGRPPGARRTHAGSVDSRGPLASRPATVHHQLYFAGHSSVWDGAPAFVDLAPAPPGHATLGRAYLIRWRQFEDLVAQENGRAWTPIDLADDDLGVERTHRIGPGRYETLLGLGQLSLPGPLGPGRHAPAVTFTAATGLSAADTAAPSVPYLRLVAGGLRETYDLSTAALAGYLGAAPGATRSCVSEVVI